MTFLLFNAPPPNAISLTLRPSSSFKPKPIPARDLVLDFGKHKGKMLGTLPSNYLKWVSKNLRAGDSESWAKRADQVLQDPVYQDRIEWELAENVLHGNNAKVAANESAVSALLEISERFGWDNEDKAGWSKVNFELLGSSKGGRIPRVADGNGGGEGKRVKVEKRGEAEDGVLREKRRERVRPKREEDKLGNKQKSWGVDGNAGVSSERSQGFDEDRTVEIYNPFPGREALLNKVLDNRRRFL